MKCACSRSMPWAAVCFATAAGVVGLAPWHKSAKVADTSPVELSPVSETTTSPAANEVVFKVDGLACEGCVADVTKELKSVPGVSDARVVLAEGRAYVTLAAEQPASIDAIVDKVGANPSHKATVEAKGPGVR